jgi:hypothetical protein
MCCGDPATDQVDRRFPLHPPVVHGPSGSVEILAIRTLFAAAEVPRVTLRTSFCPQHRHYWTFRTVLVWGGLGGLLAVVFGGLLFVVLLLTVAKFDSPLLGAFVIIPAVAYMVVWGVLMTRVLGRSIRVKLAEDGSNTLLLTNVDARYVDALERQRGNKARPAALEKPLPVAAPVAIPVSGVTGQLPAAIPVAQGVPEQLPAAILVDDDEPRVPRRQRGKADPTAQTIAAIVGGLLIALVSIAVVIKIIRTVSWFAQQRSARRQAKRTNQPKPEEKREVDRDVEPGTLVPGVPVTAPLPADLRDRPGIDLIPLLNPRKDVVHGRWLVSNGALHCNDGSFVPRMQFPWLPPEEYDFVVTFTQPGLRNGIGLIMPNPNGGSFVWYLGNEHGAGYGLLNDAEHSGRIPGLIKAKTIYTTKVEVRKDRVRALLDGKELVNTKTDYRKLTGSDWHRIHDTRFPAVACDDPAVFYYVRIIEVTGSGKKAR